MTGKEMLTGIQQLDVDLIEEAEFGAFQQKKNRFSRKKFFLFVLAAMLIVGTMTAAAVFTRWSNTMQFGNYTGAQPSEEIKKQAERSGLAVVPAETVDGKKAPVSATDNDVTVSVAQTLMDQKGGRVIFRIEGLELEEGQAPCAWWDFLIDGKKFHELGISCGGGFFNGYTGENQELPLDYQLGDGSVEFYVNLESPPTGESLLEKEMAVTFTGFGVQGERFEDEDIMTVPGKWELRWTLKGSSESPRKWTPNSKIGEWDVTLVEAEIGQYSLKTTYRINEKYRDENEFHQVNGWRICPAGFQLKDGTVIQDYGSSGHGEWNAEKHLYTDTQHSLNIVLNPDQIVGMYFYAGYELDEQGFRVDKPYYYVPLE